MLESIKNLGSAIVQERKYGIVAFRVEERPSNTGSATAMLDEFVETLGFDGLREDWKEIDRRMAQTILQAVLYRDLAYNAEIMTAKRACQLAEQFLALFTEQARYFTNAVFESSRLSMWSGITEATFDTGVICFDNKLVGILWVQDED